MTTGSFRRVIGIVGGLGPIAHLEFERRLLAAIESPISDQEYPEWVLSSIPQTPDRTVALLGQGPSPVPWLLRGLGRLAGCCDFAVITCVTAHAFLDEIRPHAGLPILDLVEVSAREATRCCGSADARIGLLATVGTLRSRVFERALDRIAPGISIVSPLDLPDGERLQEELVMRPIYGPLREGRRQAGGIKSGGDRDPETGVTHRETLSRAVRLLVEAGAACVITGCTEIPLALGRDPIDGTPLLDPLELAARAAVRIARGESPLPSTAP
jgi:aspartate racemase